MAYRSPHGRKNLLALLASFMVIAFGLAACLVIALAGGQSDKNGMYIAIGLFALIAMVPLGSLRPPQPFQPERKRSSLWSQLRDCFRRKEKPDVKITPWKRKRTNFVSTPHGNDYSTSFIPENRGKDS